MTNDQSLSAMTKGVAAVEGWKVARWKGERLKVAGRLSG